MKHTQFATIHRILLYICLVIGVACNSAATTDQPPATDSAKAAVDSSKATVDTMAPPKTHPIPPPKTHPIGPAHAHPPTTAHPPAKTPEKGLKPQDTIAVVPGPFLKKNAFLGYSYPLLVPRGETRNINAYVTIRNSTSFIKDTIKEIIIDQQGEYSEKKDTIVIFPNNILFYKSLQVSLLDPSNDFTIVRIHNSDSQEIDTVNGNRWQWSITTRSNKKVATLLLKAVGMGKDGTPDKFDDKNIPIRITLDPTISRGFFDYLTDNPAISVPIIVAFLGFIGWLIKWWLGKKKGGE